MAIKKLIINSDTLTFTDASALLAQIGSKGIPVAGLAEEIIEGGSLVYVPVTDPNWIDDGTPAVYYASIWGKFMDMASVKEIFAGAGTWLGKFLKLATAAFETDSAPLTESLALDAIDNLAGAAIALNNFLALNIVVTPVVPTAATPDNTINPQKAT